jgi:hypothetical protein
MTRYAIKHIPTSKFYYEDEGGVFLLDKEEGFITWGKKEQADEILDDMKTYSDGKIWTEDGEFPVSEFEVSIV